MSSFGGISVFSIKGPPPALAGTVQGRITRKGYPGMALTPIGVSAPPTSITLECMGASAAAIGSAIQDFTNMKGTIVSMIDDMDNEYVNLLVVDVRPVNQFRVFNPTISGYYYWVFIQIDLEHVTG